MNHEEAEKVYVKEAVQGVSTDILLQQLFKTTNFPRFIERNTAEMQVFAFHEYIVALCKERGKVQEHVIKKADIERSFGHQLFKGTRKPSRDTVIQLAFGFDADVDLAQELLKSARMSLLYPRVKRDAAIIYCLHNRYSVMAVQDLLDEMGLPLLGGTTK